MLSILSQLQHLGDVRHKVLPRQLSILSQLQHIVFEKVAVTLDQIILSILSQLQPRLWQFASL